MIVCTLSADCSLPHMLQGLLKVLVMMSYHGPHTLANSKLQQRACSCCKMVCRARRRIGEAPGTEAPGTEAPAGRFFGVFNRFQLTTFLPQTFSYDVTISEAIYHSILMGFLLTCSRDDFERWPRVRFSKTVLISSQVSKTPATPLSTDTVFSY